MTNDRPQPGYKQTEVGVIPEDWNVKPVGEAFEIRNNLRLPISKRVRDSMRGQYPYYGPTNVQDHINEYRVEGQHALIGEDGDHFLKWRDISMTLLIDGKFNVNNHAHIIKGVDNLTSWFYYFFAHRDLTPHLKRQGAGRYKLNKSTLIDIPCAIPPLPEQRSIAKSLSDVDALIAALEKAIAKKRAIKTATMQQLLTGKTRLPGFGEGKGYKESAIGVIPEDWQVKRIKDIAPLQRGFDLPTSKLRRGDYPVAYSNGVMNYHAEFMVQGPGVITGRSGTIGNVHYVSENYWPHNTALWVTAFIDSYPKYIYYFYKFLKLERFGTGSGVPTLNRNDVHDSEVAISGLEEQRAIATVLSDMDTEIAALETRLAKTRSIKQGMMQQLLTGKVRLKIEAGMDAGREDD